MRFFPEFIHKSVRYVYRQYEFRHHLYGLLHYPYYNLALKYPSEYPDIYNENGEKMSMFFIRDKRFMDSPYWGNSKYFLWDRYNIGLDVHFYTHNSMLETMGTPAKKYGWLIESEAIAPKDYKIFEKNKGLEKDFDCIFTHSVKILDAITNAKFLPGCSQPTYKKEFNIFGEQQYNYKTKNISIISSKKAQCDLHKYRTELARKCKTQNIADAFGTFDGGKFVNVEDTLTDYRFSIVVENYISPLWFTEKITNCFMSMTIPVYLGATEISKFFNIDGIITFDKKEDISNVLKKCTKEYYQEHLSAVIDNYNRIKNYNMLDNMYEKYLSNTNQINKPEDFFIS